MLEPNLKNGGGGLRDVQAPGWAAWALPAGGEPSRPARRPGWDGGVERARGARVPPARRPRPAARRRARGSSTPGSRSTGSRAGDPTSSRCRTRTRSPRLVGAADADDSRAQPRRGGAGRRVDHVATSGRGCSRPRTGPAACASPSSRPRRRHRPARRHGSRFDPDATLDTVDACCARRRTRRERGRRSNARRSTRLAERTDVVEWTDDARDAFIDAARAPGAARSRCSRRSTTSGVLVRLLPEWASCGPGRSATRTTASPSTGTRSRRSPSARRCSIPTTRPARASTATSRAAPRARPAAARRAAPRHRQGPTRATTRSSGEAIARDVAARIGLDDAGTDDLAWLVRNHLLLADTATRRDLGDERTITPVRRRGRATSERIALLYALTIGDSRATGPAAWNTSKAALVRELFVKADARLAQPTSRRRRSRPRARWRADRRGDAARVPRRHARGVRARVPARGARAPSRAADARARRRSSGPRSTTSRWRCTVVAPDRTGLLATAAGALALVGFDIDTAAAYSPSRRHRARGVHRPRPLRSPRRTSGSTCRGDDDRERRARRRAGARRAARASAPAGTDRRPRRASTATCGCSSTPTRRRPRPWSRCTRPTTSGLLARVAAVFVDLDLDVAQAIVSTVGDRVVDVFYLRDADGHTLRAAPRGRVVAGHAAQPPHRRGHPRRALDGPLVCTP